MSRNASLQSFLLDGIEKIGSTIGDGAYATVVPLNFRGLICAGKKLHAALYNSAFQHEEKERMIQRFQVECQLLSQLKHPNIVQFLGVHIEENSNLPILVMECLHFTLSECLERYGVLQQQLSLSILDDVATGLCYLHGHQPPIVHRDLSANNVLLSSDMHAKISDLGVAKLLNLTPAKASQLSKCPGTPPYMPPEALEEDPEYNRELDCFSMGVMILHVLCGKWPIPSRPNRVNDEKKLIALSEVERREKYFMQVEICPPLIKLIHSCLDNDPPQRPDVNTILQTLRDVILQSPPIPENKMELLKSEQSISEQLEDAQRECEQLREMVKALADERATAVGEESELQQSRKQANSEMIQSQLRELSSEVDRLRAVVRSKDKLIQEKEVQVIQAMEAEKQQLVQTKETEKQQTIRAMEAEHHRAIQRRTVDAIIETKQKEIDTKQAEISALLAKRDADIAHQVDVSLHNYLQSIPQTCIHWRKCADVPQALELPQSAVIGNAVYIGAQNSHEVLKYDTTVNEWSVLPPCPVKQFGLGHIQGKVITVGGTDDSGKRKRYIGDVYEFDEENKEWKKSNYPMTTTPTWPRVISCDANLIVFSKFRENNVDVFEHTTAQWYTAAPMPFPFYEMQVTVIGDTCYLGGGGGGGLLKNNSIITASMSNLFESLDCQYTQQVWATLPDLPHYASAVTNMGGALITLGGFDGAILSNCNDEIYAYCPRANAWLMIGKLPQAGSSITAEPLPSGEVMLIGGQDVNGEWTRAVYIGTLEMEPTL